MTIAYFQANKEITQHSQHVMDTHSTQSCCRVGITIYAHFTDEKRQSTNRSSQGNDS